MDVKVRLTLHSTHVADQPIKVKLVMEMNWGRHRFILWSSNVSVFNMWKIWNKLQTSFVSIPSTAAQRT
jgi:hypothetical protein